MKKNNRIKLFFKQIGFEMPADIKTSEKFINAIFLGVCLFGSAAVLWSVAEILTGIAHLIHGF